MVGRYITSLYSYYIVYSFFFSLVEVFDLIISIFIALLLVVYIFWVYI